MFYVYYLQSKAFPSRTYVGFTHNIKQRLSDHNAGRSIYTEKCKPWALVGFFGFDKEPKALQFERYLKSNTGRVFCVDISNNGSYPSFLSDFFMQRRYT